jgi:hypothetical protein
MGGEAAAASGGREVSRVGGIGKEKKKEKSRESSKRNRDKGKGEAAAAAAAVAAAVAAKAARETAEIHKGIQNLLGGQMLLTEVVQKWCKHLSELGTGAQVQGEPRQGVGDLSL